MQQSDLSRRVEDLNRLAKERFGPLREAEIKMLRAVTIGEPVWCGPSDRDDDPNNAPSSKTIRWGPDREIRSDLVRWLCIDKAAEGAVDPRGIRIHAATIADTLDLANATVRFPLTFARCRFPNRTLLFAAQLATLNLAGSYMKSIDAHGVTVDGGIFLNEGFICEGSVQLVSSRINGNLDCSGGIFKASFQEGDQSGIAINTDGAIVKSAFFTHGFTAEGMVRLVGTRIEGNLECEGGKFMNPAQVGVEHSGFALAADRIKVQGSVHLRDGFGAEGLVRLVGAYIEGNFDCGYATFKNAPQSQPHAAGIALNIGSSTVKGTVHLREGFRADGLVKLVGAHIDGDLDCHAGTFNNPAQKDVQESGVALEAGGITVKQSVFLRFGFNANGSVQLVGAEIDGDLDCDGGSFAELKAVRAKVKQTMLWRNISAPEKASLDLRDASVNFLVDHEASWPPEHKLSLDGFVYRRISEGPQDSKARLEWLRRQESFTPQPYLQLAQVLRDEGDENGARSVLFEMEHRRRNQKSNAARIRLWGSVLRWTIGYGFYPARALKWLLLLIAVGWILYGQAYWGGVIAPTNTEAYEQFHTKASLPAHYQRFYALIYSAENSFPLVNFGQKDLWTPDPGQQPPAISPPTFGGLDAFLNANMFGFHPFSNVCSAFLRCFRWLQVLLGWILATFFVAGITGIIRKN